MKRYYEAYNDRYAQVHKENLAWFSAEPSPILEEVIWEFGIRPENRMLEIGCGEGRDAGHLLKQGYHLLATDVSERAVAFCQKAYPEYASQFQMMDCLQSSLDETFDFLYAIAVVHMLVLDEDRSRFYRFIRNHLSEKGIALICTMGDGIRESGSDIETAFLLQDRQHEATGKWLRIASTSYRAVCFSYFEEELISHGFDILKQGITLVEPDYGNMMFAVVKRRDL